MFTNGWQNTGSLNTPRYFHTATLLPNGKVLVAGGTDAGGSSLASAELYDSVTETWTPINSLGVARAYHTATLLPNGKVLVAGGDGNSGYLASAELYDPASGTWSPTASLGTAREYHTATLLPNGKTLIAGGDGTSGYLASAELYDIGLGFVRPDWQPQITSATLTFLGGLILNGSRFQGISQASSGTFQDSSTNYPVVQLRAIDNSQVAFLPVSPTAGWSDTSFTSTQVTGFPAPALATVFTDGIPSDSQYVTVITSANISGTLLYCSNPVPGPVPNVTLNLTGSLSTSTLSDGSGNYTFSVVPSGGNYTVTPSKAARAPGSAGITTIDVIGIQRHFLNIGTPLSGCRLTAANVNGDGGIDTIDVIAVQRFFLGLSTGIANTGRYKFTPASRNYSVLVTDQTGQNYDTLVFGDVASPFAE